MINNHLCSPYKNENKQEISVQRFAIFFFRQMERRSVRVELLLTIFNNKNDILI